MLEQELPKAYRSREASIDAWTGTGYAQAQTEDVLLALAHAFNWKPEEALRLRPEDSLWDIYRSYHPRKGWLSSDEMELEHLVRDLEDLIDPREPDLKFPEDLRIGTLVRLATERPARECSCGCHKNIHMLHFAPCCSACSSCGIIVGRGRQHMCRYGGGEVWAQRPQEVDSGATTRAK